MARKRDQTGAKHLSPQNVAPRGLMRIVIMNLRASPGLPAFRTDTVVDRAAADKDRETASGKPTGRPGT